jgi:hypothetical protein
MFHAATKLPRQTVPSPASDYAESIASVSSDASDKWRRKFSRKISESIYTIEKMGDGTKQLVAYKGTKPYFAAMRNKHKVHEGKKNEKITSHAPEIQLENQRRDTLGDDRKESDGNVPDGNKQTSAKLPRARRFGRTEDASTSDIIQRDIILEDVPLKEETSGRKISVMLENHTWRRSVNQRVSVVTRDSKASAVNQAGRERPVVQLFGPTKEIHKKASPPSTYLDLLRLRYLRPKKLLKAFDSMLSEPHRSKKLRHGARRRHFLPDLKGAPKVTVLSDKKMPEEEAEKEDTMSKLPDIKVNTSTRTRKSSWQNSVSRVRLCHEMTT